MTIRLKTPSSTTSARPSRNQSSGLVKIAVAAFIVVCLGFFGLFAYYHIKYERLINRLMSGPIFSNTAKIYARPKTVRVGETVSVSEIAHELRRAGYSEQTARSEGGSRLGSYRLYGDAIEIRPGPESYHNQDVATVRIADGKVSQISASGQSADADIAAYELEPQLVTALFTSELRAKRQIVHFDEIPTVMVKATLSNML